MQASDITLESIDKVCQFLMEKNPQEVCDKIYENYATLLQDAVVESKEQVFVNQNPRRTLLSKETRDVLESVFAKKRFLNCLECRIIARRLYLSETQVRIWFSNKRARYNSAS
ncbi:LAMI_0F02982g1_1 [Lachancea mirantina]|uniref:LAMI_0F02982g1_1 n=1 Tax=Lachancea mirantina TaxID=1230905 RepID=A0A1G4JWV5_9SACH|nr:LAMI_0F02982g1_1 [Lachancea mirantina]